MVIKFNFKKILISLAIPLSAGGLSALITKGNMDLYSKIVTPTFAPPGWLFPVVWTILYLMMGISLYLIWNSDTDVYKNRRAFVIFAIQLLLNFIWSPIFFNMQWFLVALMVLVLLWLFTFSMILSFYNISKIAGILQIPYFLWLTFAGCLNLAIYLLN